MTHPAAVSLTAPPDSSRGLSRRAQRLVHEYIMTHLGERVSLDDLARAAGLSRFHFCRLFRRSTGHSPMRYLQLCRLEYAKRMLARGALTMAEISVLAGFCDQSHMCRSLRKATGKTPRQFVQGGYKSSTSTGVRAREQQGVKTLPLSCSAGVK